MSLIKGFGQFWYDFLIGDDWKIAGAVATVLLIGAGLVLNDALPEAVLTSLLGVTLGAAFVVALRIDTRER